MRRALSRMRHPGNKHYCLHLFYRWSQASGRRTCPSSSSKLGGRLVTQHVSALGAQRRVAGRGRRWQENWKEEGFGKEMGVC